MQPTTLQACQQTKKQMQYALAATKNGTKTIRTHISSKVNVTAYFFSHWTHKIQLNVHIISTKQFKCVFSA